MKILLAGDSHGNEWFMGNVLSQARGSDCDLVIQLGDFGFWPGAEGEFYLKRVHEAMQRYDMPLWVIDGNHDWPELYRAFSTSSPTYPTDRLQHIPRGTTFELDGRRFGFLGGAVSIDVDHRVEGRSWWPEEILSEDETNYALTQAPVDVMLSHDTFPAPPKTMKWNFPESVRKLQRAHEPRFQAVMEAWQPKLQVHGHWHRKYVADTLWGERIGLGFEDMADSIVILDTSDMSCY